MLKLVSLLIFFFSSRRRHTRWPRDWSSDVCSSDVFLPVAVVSGWAGELLRPFARTVAIAMLASLVVALTIVPVMAYWFMRAPQAARAPDHDDERAVGGGRGADKAAEEGSMIKSNY